MAPFAPAPPPGAQPAPLWGSEAHVRGLFGERVEWLRMERQVLEVTAFKHPRDFGAMFKAQYGPTITVRGKALADGRTDELDAAIDAYCDEWNLGTPDAARFELEYLLAIGTKI